MKRIRLVGWIVGLLVFVAGGAALIGFMIWAWLDPDPAYFCRQLHDAAAQGDILEMRWVARRCPKALIVKNNERSGFLPIHTAVKCHRLESVRELVALGCSLDVETTDGRTPLYLACQQGDTAIAEYLIDQGAKVNHAGGYNPLHAAAYRGDTSVVSVLLSHGADVNLSDRSGTALHIAAVVPQRQVVTLLFERGADAELTDSRGLTVVDRAVLEGEQNIVNLLIQKGAKPTLLAAIRDGNLEAVKRFLRDRPQIIHGGPGLDGATPLHYSATFGHLAICKYFVEHGANRAAPDGGGYIPAHYACSQRLGDVLRAVCTVELANTQAENGETPLHYCAEKDNILLGRILVSEYHVELNKRARDGVTPLLCAFRLGHDSFCKFLIENNADVNVAEGETRHTPLHYALFNPWKPELAELLLQKGANPHAQGVGEETPWEIAQKRDDSKRLFQQYVKE